MLRFFFRALFVLSLSSLLALSAWAAEPIKVVYHLADGVEQAARAMVNIRNHLQAELNYGIQDDARHGLPQIGYLSRSKRNVRDGITELRADIPHGLRHAVAKDLSSRGPDVAHLCLCNNLCAKIFLQLPFRLKLRCDLRRRWCRAIGAAPTNPQGKKAMEPLSH